MTTLCLSNRINENVDSKKCQSCVKIKNKTSSNEEFISEMRIYEYIYISLLDVLNEMIIVKFYF